METRKTLTVIRFELWSTHNSELLFAYIIYMRIDSDRNSAERIFNQHKVGKENILKLPKLSFLLKLFVFLSLLLFSDGWSETITLEILPARDENMCGLIASIFYLLWYVEVGQRIHDDGKMPLKMFNQSSSLIDVHFRSRMFIFTHHRKSFCSHM